MAVPYTFGSATTSIPLSQLDSNFATAITLGNTAVQLGNTITTLTGVSNLASATSLTLGSNGNTTAITVDTSQQVGINRTPSAGGGPLQVGFDSSANAGVRIQTTNASTAGEIINFINSSSSSAGKVIFGTSQTSVAYQTTTGGQSTGAVLQNSGIAFPATQVTSSDANTLDDYEEGTFTPVLYAGGSIPTGTSVVALGTYTKIGRMVSYIIDIGITTLGTGSGSVQIRGMPFTVSSGVNAYACPACESENLVSALTGFVPLLPPSTTYFDVYFNWNGTSGPTQLQYSGCKGGTGFRLTGLYYTS